MLSKMPAVQERDGYMRLPRQCEATAGNDLSGSMEGAGGIGGLLARSDGYSSGNFTTHNFYFADGNGNITYMLNSSQAMVASYRYDPFGNLISSSGTLASANVYRFSSKEIHVNSGMYYYGYRFYDPNLQRWINRDPIWERGGRNLYRFVSADPVSRRDKAGLLPDGPIITPPPPSPPIISQILSACACRSMIQKAMYDAEDWATKNFGVIGGMHSNEGSVVDMLTHCVGACQVAKGEGDCKDAGIDARKYLQDRENPLTRGGNRMDFENNKVGFGIADSGGDCKQGCLKAFTEGKLWTVDLTPPYAAHPFVAHPTDPAPGQP